MANSPDSVRDGVLLSSDDQPFNNALFSIDDDDCRTNATTVCASNVQSSRVMDNNNNVAVASADKYNLSNNVALASADKYNLSNKLVHVLEVLNSENREAMVIFLNKSFWIRGERRRKEIEYYDRFFRMLVDAVTSLKWNKEDTTALWNALLYQPQGSMAEICSYLEPLPAEDDLENLIKKIFQVVNDVQNCDDRDVFVFFLSRDFWRRRSRGRAELRSLEKLFRDLMELTLCTRWSEENTTTLWNELVNAPDNWMPIILSRLQPIHYKYNMVFAVSRAENEDNNSNLFSDKKGPSCYARVPSPALFGPVGPDTVDNDDTLEAATPAVHLCDPVSWGPDTVGTDGASEPATPAVHLWDPVSWGPNTVETDDASELATPAVHFWDPISWGPDTVDTDGASEPATTAVHLWDPVSWGQHRARRRRMHYKIDAASNPATTSHNPPPRHFSTFATAEATSDAAAAVPQQPLAVAAAAT